jgi:hypothetical protein
MVGMIQSRTPHSFFSEACGIQSRPLGMYHINDPCQRCQMPPSSSGPGRSPLKAQTGVRVPLGAQTSHNKVARNFFKQASLLKGWNSSSHGAQISGKPPTHDVERFLSLLRFDSREKLNTLGRYADLEVSKTDNWQFESPF